MESQGDKELRVAADAQKLRGYLGGELGVVVLRHEGVAVPHFDVMVDVPGEAGLWTWRVAEFPGAAGGERIADHRRAYWEYEGEVSGGRGRVHRVFRGVGRVVDVRDGWVVLGIGDFLRKLPLEWT